MVKPEKKARRAYVLDTNVLIHDPASIYKFHEHAVLLPITVLEELDHLKVGRSDVARSARQATRNLGRLLDAAKQAEVGEGLPLGESGRLYFLSSAGGEGEGLDGAVADNRIINAARRAQAERPDETVILVSKDVNLRVKCAALDMPAEDFHGDRQVDDIDAMVTGVALLADDFWQQLSAPLESWQRQEQSYYRVRCQAARQWHPGMLVAEREEGGFEALVRHCDGELAELEVLRDHRGGGQAVWGVQASNRLQNFALNLLLDPEIDLVSLAGSAGTGKTFLALAAALHQIYEERRFERVIITRETVSMGEDIGFLPGTEEEKMGPWMGGIHDNMDSLLRSEGGWASAATRDLLAGRIQMRALSLMRGRTFNDTLLIVDEAQNLSPKQMRAVISRAGRNTKVVCLGNVGQIDSPYLTETTCGMTYLVQRFRHWPHAGHVTLTEVERSRLAQEAEQVL